MLLLDDVTPVPGALPLLFTAVDHVEAVYESLIEPPLLVLVVDVVEIVPTLIVLKTLDPRIPVPKMILLLEDDDDLLIAAVLDDDIDDNVVVVEIL